MGHLNPNERGQNGVTKGQENTGDFFEKIGKNYKHVSILRLRSRRPSSQPRTFAS